MPRSARQPGLFDAAPALPEGMVYRPQFISEAEERELIARLETLDFEPFRFQGFEGKRRVRSYGWKYDFSRSHLLAAEPIPDWLDPLRERVGAFAGRRDEAFQQVLINEYRVGAPIGWHRDRPVFETVVGVSLRAPALFRMRRRRGSGFERMSVPLAPRSAYLLAGPARTDWEHSIGPAPEHRYSITFRNLRR